MFNKIVTRARVLAAAFGAGAVATSAFASPVVVTPGASAGYLYFPSGTGGSGGSGAPTVTGCYIGMPIPADIVANPMPCASGDSVYASGSDNTVIGKYGGHNPVINKHLVVGMSQVSKEARCDDANSLSQSGKTNTTTIVQKCPTRDNAAKYCSSLGPDWFLPSKTEMDTIFSNRATIGGYDAVEYWSSTSKGFQGFYRLNFSTGGWYDSGGGDYILKVRCARYL